MPDDEGLREEIAAALHESGNAEIGLTWEELPSIVRDGYLRLADAALASPAVARALATVERLSGAITDLCWKATPFGGGDDVTAYLLPAGTVHRLIGAAQGVGIPAAFRAITADGTEPHPAHRHDETGTGL